MRTPAIWKPETRASQTDAGPLGNAQTEGTIAALPNGSFDIVWLDFSGVFGNSNLGVLVGRQFDANGNPLTNDVPILSSAQQPALTGLPNNGAALAFESFASSSDIYVEKFNSSFQPSGVLIPIEVSPLNSSGPSIASFADGSIFVTYQLASSTDVSFEGQFVNSSGTLVGVPVNLVDGTNLFAAAKVAALTNGNIIFVDENQANGSDNAFFQIRTTSGSVVTSRRFLASSTGGLLEPDVAALRTGGFVVTWTEIVAGDENVHAQVFDQSGNIVRSNFVVNTTRTGSQDEAHVTAMDDGGFLVSWRDNNLSVVVAQRFDSAGNAVGGEFRTHTGAISNNDVTALADGRAVFVTDTISGNNEDINESIWDTRHNDTNMVSGSSFAGSSTADVMIERESTANNSPGGIRTYLAQSINNAQPGAQTTCAIVGSDWMLSASGDFNNDGRADMVAQHDVGGARHIDIFSTGANGGMAADLADRAIVGTDWQVSATGDFDHDGFSDILISRDAGGTRTYDIIGIVNNQPQSTTQVAITGTQTILDRVGDFNGDGTPDLLFHTDSGGVRTRQIQDMQNGHAVGGAPVAAQIGADWQIDGIADFNGDGTADILIHRDSATSRTIGLLTIQNNVQTGFQQIGVISKEWQIEGVGNYEGTGKPDILIQSIANFGTANAHNVTDVFVVNNSDPNHITTTAANTIAVTGVDWQLS